MSLFSDVLNELFIIAFVRQVLRLSLPNLLLIFIALDLQIDSLFPPLPLQALYLLFRSLIPLQAANLIKVVKILFL